MTAAVRERSRSGSSDLEELLDSLDMETYLDREGVDYKVTHGSSGTQLNLKECPCCGNTRWRVYLNADNGLGNCFAGGCEAKFSKWKFVKAHTGLENGQVVRHIKEVVTESGWRPKRKVAAAVDETTVKLPDSIALPHEGENLIYLEKRGVNAETAAYFHLRYCEDGWWNFIKDDGSRGGQNFRGRVIVPVFDLDGALVTFQGRDVTGESDRKYLFPSGLPGTGRFLYNGQNVFRAKRVVLNEGAFDVIATKLAVEGDPALRDIVPLGSFGKHLSYGDDGGNDQLGRFIRLKAAGLEEVIIMWDGEAKALTDACKAGMMLRSMGLRVRIAFLPMDCDPNEVDAAVVRQAIWEAKLLTPARMVEWQLRNPYRKH